MEATLRTLIQRVVVLYLDGSDTQNADTKSCCSYLDGSDTQNADTGRWITVLKVDVGQGGAEAASQ